MLGLISEFFAEVAVLWKRVNGRGRASGKQKNFFNLSNQSQCHHLKNSYFLAAKWGKYFALGKSSEFFLLFSDAQGKTDNLSTGSKIFVLVRNIVWFSWSPEYFTCTTKEGIMVGGNHGDRVETMETIWLLSWRRGQHELDSNSQWMHWWETPCAALTRLTTEVVYSTIFVTSGRSE